MFIKLFGVGAPLVPGRFDATPLPGTMKPSAAADQMRGALARPSEPMLGPTLVADRR